MEKLHYILLNTIDKIVIYQNVNKWDLPKIVKNQKPDYAITGVFYNTSWKPTCHLKKDGVVLSKDKYQYRGFMWNNGPDIKWGLVPTESGSYKNHYACCTLISNGTAYPDNLVIYNKDVGGVRGRTAVGLKSNCLVLYASKDGSKDAKTPEKLRDYLFAKGVEDLVMGDGGGKVNFYDGEYMTGSAKSQNLLLIYLKKDSNSDDNNSMSNDTPTINQTDSGLKITESLLTNNPRQKNPTPKSKYGYMQHSTGVPGAKAKSFISNWNKSTCQAETELIIDDTGIYRMMDIGIRTWHCGGSGNNTHVGCEVCEPIQTRLLDVNWYSLSYGGKNNTEYAVTLLQKELQAWGFNPNGIDGIFGGGTKNAVIAFQKKYGLTPDGIVGKGTLHKLQERTGSYLKYNPDETKDYFENVYNKAVWTCSWVLDKLGTDTVNSKNVLSHNEGYKAGIASNHADVGHWWPEHGKTMDDFRQDVVNYRKTGKLPFGNDNKESKEPEVTVPTEMEQAWDKCCDAGLFDGTNPTGNVTRRQLATVLVRAGVVK